MDRVRIRHFILRCNVDATNDFSQTVQLPHFKQISDFALKITFQTRGKIFTNLFSLIHSYCVETAICVHGCVAFFFITCIFSNLVVWYKLIHTKVSIYLIVKNNVQHIFDYIYRFNIYYVHHVWFK